MNLLQLLFEKKQVSSTSAYNLQESVRRLRAAVGNMSWWSFGQGGVVGKVSEAKVILYRNDSYQIRPNSFRPVFYGQFKVRNGVTVLKGHFSMALNVRIGITVWFSPLFIFGTAIIVAGLMGQISPTPLTSPPIVGRLIATLGLLLFPSLMICFGIGLVSIGKWLSRDDEAHISEVIKSALETEK